MTSLSPYNVALRHQEQGAHTEALQCYELALKQGEQNAALFNNIGVTLEALGRPLDAIACYTQGLKLFPNEAPLYFNLAVCHQRQGNLCEALELYSRTIKLSPSLVRAHIHAGTIFFMNRQFKEAGHALLQAVRLSPDNADYRNNYGLALLGRGLYEQALEQVRIARRLDPSNAAANWTETLALPKIYPAEQDILKHRQCYRARLEALSRNIPLRTPAQIRSAVYGLGHLTNFHLPYQGLNDIDLQKQYGRLACRIMGSAFPQWSHRREMPKVKTQGRIRIGYVCSFMRNHTVGLFLKGWLQDRNRDDFTVYCYHLRRDSDNITAWFRRDADTYRELTGTLAGAAAQIAADALDVLVYTDIGMHATATQLAALRLAPVQCKAWGHPVTTGLPTMDYYLSSDMMEPAGAAKHYSEKLIRLPNLALNISVPDTHETPLSRQTFGLTENDFIFLSPHNLGKYLPQHDHLFPEIALRAPQAKFIFVEDYGDQVAANFKQRLEEAFERYGLAFGEHGRIISRMSTQAFSALNAMCDAYLDTPTWSGGRTTLEAIANDLPIVTVAGEFMRGRHAYAMLSRIGVHDSIAKDKGDYINIAARLASDSHWHARLAAKITARKTTLYGDQVFVDSLESFYKQLTARKVSA